MINKYVFDYQLVLEENPLFEKFVDVKDTIDNLKERYSERYYADQVNNTKKENNSESENDIIDFVHDKENMDVDLDETDAWINDLRDNDNNKNIREVNLKPEYIDAPNPNYNSSVLQLLPPNRFLLPGSRTWQGEYTFYNFEHTFYNFTSSNIYDNNNFICLIHKHRFSKKDHFIRLQKTVYRFDRKRNVISERKKHFIMWTYNTKTKQLYKIKKVKNDRFNKRSHFHNLIQKAFNTLSNNSWSDIPIQITNKFINTILEAAKKDVPGLVLLDEKSIKPDPPTVFEPHKIVIPNKYVEEMKRHKFRKMSLAAIILQHRVGQPIKWLNYTLMQNLWSTLGDFKFQEKVLLGMYGHTSEGFEKVRAQSKTLRRKTVYQLVPNLRKSNHMKTAIKTILGKEYSKFFIKLLNTNRMGDMFLSEWLHATNKDLISKNLYHWVAQTINTNNSSDVVTDMMNNVNRILDLILRNQNNKLKAYNNDFNWDQFSIILDSYIKMYKKIVTIDVALPRWDTWYDTYNMASQLGIRVRPNKLNSNNEIRHLHDKLAEIINRDRVTIKKYKNSIFEEFISPDKKYDGFEFIQMRTAQDLVDEGTTMKHCVGSYADKCANGRSIIFSMRKDGKGYVTIELDTVTYKVSQQYTLHDITITSHEALNIIDRWDNDCIELHKDDKESYHGICQRKVKEYMEKEKAKNLKELVKNGIVDSESQILKGYQHEGEKVLHAAAI